MFGKHHALAEDFPQFRDRIAQLMQNDAKFAQLHAEYAQIDEEVFRIEEDIETPSDEYTESLKLRRVALKDELYAMLKED
ncbi:YdcH family protein [Kaarinaea lacus]